MLDSALHYAEKIAASFPGHSLGDEIMLMKAQLYHKKKQYEMADSLYEKLVETYPSDILADNALFELAQIQQYQLKNLEKAKANYQKLIVDYTQSLFVSEARIQFRKLRGF
jgi:TolA-binding protein